MRAKTVAGYIARAPKAMQSKLRQLRAAIRCAAPGAQERISYQMPYYHYKGRLAYFSLWKDHIGLYVPAVVGRHKRELEGYSTTAATVRFPVDRRLPIAIVRKLIRARVKLNDAAAGADKARSTKKK